MITEYSHELYSPTALGRAIARAVETLTPELGEFDSIVVRGTSGTIFGGALSVAIGKRIFVVRKPMEKSHARALVSGEGSPGRWLFVDDFVCSGRTRDACLEAIGKEGEWVGSYTYERQLGKGLVWSPGKGRKGTKEETEELFASPPLNISFPELLETLKPESSAELAVRKATDAFLFSWYNNGPRNLNYCMTDLGMERFCAPRDPRATGKTDRETTGG